MKIHFKNCNLDIIIHSFTPGFPANLWDEPGKSYPAEPDEIEWEIGRALIDSPYTPEEWTTLTRLEKDNYELIVDEMTRFNSDRLTAGEKLELENMILQIIREDG